MSVYNRRLAELMGKEIKGTKILTVREQQELYNLLERQDADVQTSRKTLTQIVNTTTRIELETAEHVVFSSGGNVGLNSHTLTLGANLTTSGSNLTLAASGAYTLTVAGSSIVSGTNTGDETLAATSGLTLSNHVLAVGAGDGIDVLTNSIAVDVTDLLGTGITESSNNLIIDQAFSPTWTGEHVFQGNMTTRHILPEATDTYDIGSTTKLFRKGYLSEIDAIIFAQLTKTVVGGWLSLAQDEGAFPANVAAADATIDFGKAMTVGDFLEIRAALKVEYIQVGSLVTGTTYNVTRNLDGTGANDWAAGSVWQAKRNGAGFIDLNSYDTPRIQLLTQGATYNAQTEVLRIGDLNANWGYASATYGMAIGEYGSGKVNLTLDPTNGYRLRTYNVTQFSVTPNLLKFGSNVGAAGTTALVISGAAQTYNSETLGDGDLLIGDNTASKANVLWDKSAGTMLFRGGTTVGLTLDTTGTLSAGPVTLDSNGIRIPNVDVTENPGAYSYSIYEGSYNVLEIWSTGDGGIGYIGANNSGLVLRSTRDSSNALLYLDCLNTAEVSSHIYMIAGVDTGYIELMSDVIGLTGGATNISTPTTISYNSTTTLLVEQDGVKDNVLVVDTTNGAVGIMQAATSGVPLSVYGRGDGGSVLRLNTSRAWEFQQDGADGAGACLRLRDLNTAKSFYIDTSGTFAVRKVDGSSTLAKFDMVNLRLGINDTSPAEALDVTGNINCTGVIKVDDVQVVGNRVIDSRIDDSLGSAFNTEHNAAAGVIDAIRDAMIDHGLIAAS